jgi:lipopolysaccharide biosynthesis protein
MNNPTPPLGNPTKKKEKVINPPAAVEYVDAQFQNARMKWEEQEKYVPITTTKIDASSLAIRALAFYLPQFYPFPENDAWWGKGFTEWTNVTRAVPLFKGHEQPRLPGELGFYDLRAPHVMERQVELAKLYGIAGFCFHYYWFAGKRLLEKPLEHFLNTPSLDISFCINYANENWTRTWDGSEKEMLMEQQHSPEDDVAMIKDACRYFRDPRYVRIDGKPVFIVYRIGLFPDMRATIERWRETCQAEGIGEIFVVTVRSFQPIDPSETGADAAVEFPPHGRKQAVDVSQFVLNTQYTGIVYDYRSMVIGNCGIKPEELDHIVLRGIMPSWDNTARRPDGGNVYLGATPELYKMWLTHICDYTLEHYPPDHNLIFINAWNEWAEGAYLEPDRRYGYAFLQATADSLSQFPLED